MTSQDFEENRSEITRLCDSIGTAIGPFGANKVVVERDGSVSMPARGVDIVEKLRRDRPAVTLLAEMADGFENRYRDGTSTLLSFAGALLVAAESLREQGLHPTTIDRGYRRAAAVATDRIDQSARPLDDERRRRVCATALTNVRSPTVTDQIAESLVSAVEEIAADAEFDPDTVRVQSRLGGATSETSLVDGLVIDQGTAFEGMPRRADDAGVAILSSTVDFRRIGSPAERTSDVTVSLSAESFAERNDLRERERESLHDDLQQAVDAGCGVLVTTHAISDRVKAAVSQYGVTAIQHVDEADAELLSRLTGAEVVPHLADISPETLGTADVSVERKAGRDMTFVRGTREAPVWTLFCRAPDPHSVESFERSVRAALYSLSLAEETGTVVPGGGAIEVDVAQRVRAAARSVADREQLAMERFADAVTCVPRVLAENSGLDAAAAMARLDAAHSEGRDSAGVDSVAGETTDVVEGAGLFDPVALKEAIIETAVDVAVQYTRIDEQLPASDLSPSAE